MFSDIAEGEKQDILNRINKIEIEYQKAGADGAFNAGLETGQLFTKVAGYIVTVKVLLAYQRIQADMLMRY
ncbi:hypothetical protein J4731_21550 [Providencia rettgeri]|nr:hypothetical protein [Providencia rettgeri]